MASNSQHSSYLCFTARITGLSHHAQRILILETSIALSFVTENCVPNLHYPSRLDIHLHWRPSHLQGYRTSECSEKQNTTGPLCWLRFILRGPSGWGQRTRRRVRQRLPGGSPPGHALPRPREPAAAAGHRPPGDRKGGSGRSSSNSAAPTAASSLTHPENTRCTRASSLRAPLEPRAEPTIIAQATAPPRAGHPPGKPPLAT